MKKLFKTAYVKIIIGYLIFIISSAIYITYEYENNIMDKQISSIALSLYNQVNGISGYYSNGEYNIYNDSEVYDYNKDIKSFMQPDDTSIWILSNMGMILYSSDTSEVGHYIDISTHFDSNYYSITDFGGITKSEVVAVYSPIVHAYKTYGYVIIHKDIESIKASFAPLSNYLFKRMSIVFVFSLVILVFIHFFFFVPTKKIQKVSRELAKGNFDYKKPRLYDEYTDISEKLSFIANEMKSTDNNQKKFISNISHDFRSPLTSIKGYIEAMLDGTIPPELHEKYLKVLLFETERLNKLTGSLLTLNTWNTKENRLELSDFDIIPLTRNILASFEGQCISRQISFDVYFDNKSYVINADQTKIQQVIYNLLDNAIKFSYEHSFITIHIYDKNDTVFVSIKDSGIGIPKDNISKIWDRFYKTDLSRGKDKTGSGLGLSIVKEIITSHGENINVISTEGAGTEFVFTLSKSKKSLLPLVSS